MDTTTNETPRRPACAYLRRSTDRQEQSIEDQRRAILRYAEQHGLRVVREYVDDAVSGTSTDGRVSFQRMIHDAAAADCPWRGILVFDISRFSRGDVDEVGYHRHVLRKAGIRIVYVAENLPDDETGDLLRPVKQWQAREYSRSLSKVTLRGELSRASKGGWCGGTPPHGYDAAHRDPSGKVLQVVRWMPDGTKQLLDEDGNLQRLLGRDEKVVGSDRDMVTRVPSSPERIAVVREIFEMYVHERLGYKPIAERLNARGVPSPRNAGWSRIHSGQWALSTIRAILINPIYCGDMAWNRSSRGKFHKVEQGLTVSQNSYREYRRENNDEQHWVIAPKAHEAIVPRDIFERAKQIRLSREHAKKSSLGGRGRTSRFLLSGLMVCEKCGHRYQGYTTTKGKPRKDGSKIQTSYYCCGGYITKGNSVCKRVLFPMKEVEAVVRAEIGKQVEEFLGQGGDELLRHLVRDEILSDRSDPRIQARGIRVRLSEIQARGKELVSMMTPTNRDFLDKELADLQRERRSLEARLESIQQTEHRPPDLDALVRDTMAYVARFDTVFGEGRIEERKTFVRAFVERIDLDPTNGKGHVLIRKLPVPAMTENGSSSLDLVDPMERPARDRTVVRGRNSRTAEMGSPITIAG